MSVCPVSVVQLARDVAALAFLGIDQTHRHVLQLARHAFELVALFEQFALGELERVDVAQCAGHRECHAVLVPAGFGHRTEPAVAAVGVAQAVVNVIANVVADVASAQAFLGDHIVRMQQCGETIHVEFARQTFMAEHLGETARKVIRPRGDFPFPHDVARGERGQRKPRFAPRGGSGNGVDDIGALARG